MNTRVRIAIWSLVALNAMLVFGFIQMVSYMTSMNKIVLAAN